MCRSRRETPPALWSVQDWQRLVERQQHEPLFDMDAVRAQYAAQSFRDDGYCVFRGIMTEETRRQWTQAMIDLHALNDQMISSDWRSAVDWRTLRVRPPLSVHTPEQKAAALGGAQRLTPMNDDNGGFAMRLHGVLRGPRRLQPPWRMARRRPTRRLRSRLTASTTGLRRLLIVCDGR